MKSGFGKAGVFSGKSGAVGEFCTSLYKKTLLETCGPSCLLLQPACRVILCPGASGVSLRTWESKGKKPSSAMVLL